MIGLLTRKLSKCLRDRDGAVTVDFVILTASVVIIFTLIVSPIYEQTGAFVVQISDKLVEYAGSFADDM